jgi:hypothetical protein
LIVPNDATYRVQVHGTGSGTLTLDATDYDGKNKLAFQQYASVPVTPQSRGTLTIGDVGTPFSWDVSGSGNAAALTPTTSTTNPADDTTDTSAPSTTASVSGTAGQQGFYRSAVDVRLTASDDLSGVGRTDYSLDGGAIWTPYDGPLHITGDGAHQVLYRSVDYLGNQEAANTLSFTIDTVPPSVAINSPTARTYTLNAAVAAGYSCSDSGSGVATCAGPVASGDAVPTGSVGSKSFTVNATDRAGNSASSTVTYTVTYGICALYDQTKAVKAGSTVPIKLMLCDASGADVSAAGVVVSATGVTQTSTDAPGSLADSGNANPDNNFRFDATLGTAGGYIYNFSTANMITGTYAVKFRVANDPVEHTLSFQVK